LFPGMDAHPASPQPQHMGAQQQILNGRRTVLQQVAQLLVVRGRELTADGDAQSGTTEHLPVRQGGGNLREGWPVANHHETPRVFAGR